MKHPALARVMALTLAVLCFVMLLAGGLGIRSAIKERLRGWDDIERLNGRVEEYRLITQALDGTLNFKEAQAALDERQEKHDDDAAKHRTDLATYTATKSGVNEGIAAIDEADAAFAEGKAAYEESRRAFEAQAAAFEEMYATYMTGAGMMAGILGDSESLSAMMAGTGSSVRALTPSGSLDDPGEPEARQAAALDAYDGLLSSIDQALTTPSNLEGAAAFAQQVAAEPEQVQGLMQQMSALSNVGESSGLDPATVAGVQQSIAVLSQAGSVLAADASQTAGAMQYTAGELAALRAQVQADRDAVAAMDPETDLDDEGYAAVQGMYAADQAAVAGCIDSLAGGYEHLEQSTAAFDAQTREAQQNLSALGVQLEAGKAALDAGRAALDKAGKEIEKGADALYWGRAEIWFQMGKLEEQEDELKKGKEELDKEAEELATLDQAAKEQKEMEERETATRLNLLSRDGIQELVDAGEAVLPAAEAYAAQAAADIDRNYRDRMSACVLMAIGALAGFLAIPAAFERMKKPLARLLPTLLCLGCAAAAELIFVNMGRGSSYSALAAGAFALLMLPLLWPAGHRPG